MAEAPTLTFVLEAQDRVTAQLQKVEQSLNNLNNKANATKKGTDDLGKSTGDLSGLMGGLGKMVAWVGGMSALTLFLKSSTEAAVEDSKALILLQARLRSVGESYVASKDKISGYTDKMVKLGIAESETNDGLGKLITKTSDMDKAMRLSSLAADLAASGYGSYADNIDNLTKILSGRGAMAMKAYNIKMDENATTAEQLNAVQGKVTLSATEMADTTVGKLQVMNTNWGEFKGNIGKVGLFFEGTLADQVNTFFENTGINQEIWLKKIIKDVAWGLMVLQKSPEILTNAAEESGEEMAKAVINPFLNMRDSVDNFWNKTILGEDTKFNSAITRNLGTEKLQKNVDDINEKVKNFGTVIDQVFAESDNSVSGFKKTVTSLSEEDFPDLSGASENAAKKSAEAWDKAAAKMKSDFTSFSNKMLGEVDKQKDAILKLRETMMNAQEKYNAEVERINKDSSLNIEGHPEIITPEKAAALASAQNDLDMAISAYRNNESEAQRQLLLMAVRASDPNLMSKVSKESDTFLYGIGQSAVQQQFTFNFNGDVNDIEKLKQLIIAALDRQASLAKVQ